MRFLILVVSFMASMCFAEKPAMVYDHLDDSFFVDGYDFYVPTDADIVMERRKCHGGGHGGSCALMGVWFIYGVEGVLEKNAMMSVEYHTKSCNSNDAKWAESCLEVANAYRYGDLFWKGLSHDIFKAFDFDRKACSLRLDLCGNLASDYLYGRGVRQDSNKAIELYGQSCGVGSGADCYLAGNVYAKGEGVPRNEKEALEFYGKACDNRYVSGCEAYAELKQILMQRFSR